MTTATKHVVTYDVVVTGVDEEAANVEATRWFTGIPGADRYAIREIVVRQAEFDSRGLRPEWHCHITAEHTAIEGN